eukprot:3968693-Pyramimonas_sp.AAC.1
MQGRALCVGRAQTLEPQYIRGRVASTRAARNLCGVSCVALAILCHLHPLRSLRGVSYVVSFTFSAVSARNLCGVIYVLCV